VWPIQATRSSPTLLEPRAFLLEYALVDYEPSLQSPSEDRLLLDELTHRVSNELASAIGIVAAAAARSSAAEVKVALGRVRERLEGWAQVQVALRMPDYDTLIDASTYLRQLCHALVHSQINWQEIELSVRATPLQLHAVQCWRMGLIVAELVTNSARHAFSGNSGAISVELGNCLAGVECCVEDNGSATVDVRPGRGLRIVAALTQKLGGTLDQRFGPRGTRSTLTFPLVL
jgi:two-component sensor histidine kinase